MPPSVGWWQTGGGDRSSAGFLPANERKNDPSELKQAKRRVGMLRRWLKRLPDGALDATPLNKRRARWALLLDGAEPGFRLKRGVAARLQALVDKPSRPGVEQPSQEVPSSEPDEASHSEYRSADFETPKADLAERPGCD